MADWPYNTGAWKKLRAAHLAHSPFCEGCTAMGNPYRLANTVDHRHAMSEGGPAFPGHDGLASYCPSCHSAKTARGAEAGAIKSTKPRRGCNPDGTPLDPSHPWHAAKQGKVAPASPCTAGAQPQRLTLGEDDAQAVALHSRTVAVVPNGKSLRAVDGRPAPYIQTQLVLKRD